VTPVLIGNHRPGSKRWHAARAKGIGASEIAAVLGLHPWQSPFSLHHRKAGSFADEFADSPAIHWGHRHEALIADEWAVLNPWATVKRCGTYARHDDPWMTANPDRLVYDSEADDRDELQAVLEIKNTRHADGWGPDGSDEIPVHYRCQVMQQMHVMEVPVAYVAVLIGGSDYRSYTIDYDPAEAAMLARAGRAFWRDVQAGIAPPIDASQATTDTLKRLHPDVEDTEVMVDADLAADYRAALLAAQEADRTKQAATNRLLDAIGPGRVAVDPAGVRLATRSVSTPSRFDRAALKRDHPDLESQYTVAGQPAARLTPNMKAITS